MPRNASGTYTLPTGNPVVSGTLIEADWANTTLNDLANEITDSLSRSGEGGMLAPFRLADGLQASPGIAWLNEPSTGFYREGSGEMWGVVGGAQILQYTATGVLVPTGKTLTANGGITATTLTTSGAATLASASVTGNLSVGGTLTLTGGLTLNGNVTVGDSSADTLTINSTITSHLLFTDNTYDIGASGATRPRNLYLAGDGVIGGTLGVTGVLTASAGLTGNVTGNLTGNVTGSISGGTVAGSTGTFSSNVTVGGTLGVTGATTLSSTLGVTGAITASGGVSGNVTGNLTGNVTGSISGGTVAGSTGSFSSNVTVGGTLGVTGVATLTANPVLSAGTANGVLYLNGSKEATSGSAITYDGTTFKADSAAVFNDSGADVDFRVESDTNANAFFLDGATGNIGVGVTPSAWSGRIAIQVDGSSFVGASDRLQLYQNSYFDGSAFKYIDSDYASLYNQVSGQHQWLTAASGTAGASFSFTQAMTLDASGNLGIGTNSPTEQLSVVNSSGRVSIFFASGGTNQGYISYFNSSQRLSLGNAAPTGTGVNGGEQLNILSSGNVGIGTTSPGTPVEISRASANPTLTLRRTTTVPPTTLGESPYISLIDSEGTGTGQRQEINFGFKGSVATYQPALIGYVQTSGIGYTYGDLYFATRSVTTDTAPTERMRIDSSGLVGIGTSSPATKLHVYQATGNTALRVESAAVNSQAQINFKNDARRYNAGINSSDNFVIEDDTAAATRLTIDSSGEVYIAGTTDQGAYNLQCNGTGVWGAGAYVNGSDERIKEDIAPIASSLDVVEKLNPVTYRYKESWSKDQSVQTGFIAQELLTALDGQVYVDGVVQQGGAEGYYSVAYQNIIPILTKAIQELSAKNDALEARIAALEAK